QQTPVRPGYGSAAAQQNEGVQSRNAPRAHALELAADMAWAVRRPNGLEPLPQIAGRPRSKSAFAGQPRHRVNARVKERAEERGKEKYFRGNEPNHPHSE